MAVIGGLARLGMFLSVLAILYFLVTTAWVAAGVAFVVGCACTAVANALGTYP